ncbi:MAG TPA: glucose 1-dehydrogenase [Candidatus Dormibacteraeota bacterium]|jgi:NAD(P)-dependent dehydrogenase (short-subunit alcohol dehydrogenase family)
MDLQLKGKAAIVTGGSKGIGLACVEVLAEEGMSVAILDRDVEAGHEAVDRLAAGGADVAFVQCDLADRAGLVAAVDRACDGLRGVHVLVNSAGIQEYGNVVDTPEEQWDRVLAVNLTGAFLVSKQVVPRILASGGGAIVNIASVQAFAAQRNVVAYASSKGGLVQLTRAMAVDLAPAIRVNCVCPGSVDTPMLRSSARLFSDHPDEAIAEWGKMHPMGRVASPGEVAAVAAFLASPRAGFTTASAYFADGGLLSLIG